MEEWEKLTTQGKQAYREKAYQKAIEQHQKALKVTLATFDSRFPDAPDNAIASVLISYFNVIDCYESLHHYHAAIDLFIAAKVFLDEIRLSAQCEDNSHAVMRGQKLWHFEWLNFIRRHSASVSDLLKQAPARSIGTTAIRAPQSA
ncbi:hypothetical protein [Hahella ganghwensis]|uniref:hypothetical protein n=1 Tax=Hahella ganghwensis TaxID=286420 RepID=UPI00036850D6|nr:hypothetical protein [Hahella ganghwensis]